RTDLVLLNSNPNASIVASEVQAYHVNYYTGNLEGKNLNTYKTVTYKDIYPHIDMVLHAKTEGLKYEFIIYPGGNVADIQMKWNGLENLEMTEDGGISYAFKLGLMTESKPVSYQGNIPV